MNNVKQVFRKTWWLILIIFFIMVKILPNKSSATSRNSSSSQYYKWPCLYCGKKIPVDEMLSPNEGVYTPENGFAFCSQDCFHAWRRLQ